MLTVYLIALVLAVPVLVLQEVISKKDRKTRSRYTVVAWYVIFLFVVLVGLRDTATISIQHFRQSDELAYRIAFDLLIGTPFSLANVASFEWGRYVLDWTLANIFKDSQMWVFTYALLTNYLFVQSIRKYVKPFWLGIFLYITFGLLTFQMNGTTSVLAGAILLKSIDFAVKRKFLKYLFVVFIAGSIHFSAWIMLPLYLVLTKRGFTKGTLFWIVITVIFMFGFNSIANFILPITPYASYILIEPGSIG